MVRVKIKGNANNSTDGSTSSGSGSGGEDDDNLLDGDPPDFYAMTSQQQPEPGNMKTAMKPCSSSKMEFKSGDQEAIPEHAYLHSNSFLAPGMVSSTPSPAPQKLRRHTTCVEAMPFSSSMHPHSTSDSDLIQQQRRHGTMIGIGEVLYSSMIYQQSTADLIQQQRRHSMIGEVPSPSMYQQSTSDSDLIQQQRRHGTMIGEVPYSSMYQQSNHNLPSRMMVPSNNSMMLSDHRRNMNLTRDTQSPMSVPSAQIAHSSSTATFRRSTSFEPLPFGNGDDLCENLSFDNEEEKDPPDEFSQFIDNAIHNTE